MSLAIETERLSISQALEKLNCHQDAAEGSASGTTYPDSADQAVHVRLCGLSYIEARELRILAAIITT